MCEEWGEELGKERWTEKVGPYPAAVGANTPY